MRHLIGVVALLGLAAAVAAEPNEPTGPVGCTIRPLSDQITLGVPFGLDVTLENTSKTTLVLPDPGRGDGRFSGYGRVYLIGDRWETRQPVNATDLAPLPPRIGTAAAPQLGAGDVLVLAPGAEHRFTVWALWENKDPVMVPGSALPVPRELPLGRCRLVFEYVPPAAWLWGRSPVPGATVWLGPTASPAQAIDIVRAKPAKVVAMTLDVARTYKGSEPRILAQDALAAMACRHFGRGLGLTDDDVAAAEKWFETNSGKTLHEWIAAALTSADSNDRAAAARLALLLKEPALADALVAGLNPAEVGNSINILNALWANYDDPRAMAYARSVLRDGPWVARAGVIHTAYARQIKPIMKEGGEALVEWIKAERDPEMLEVMISLARTLKIVQAVPVLEELDRRQPMPAPKELIQALGALEGKDYAPRLIQHLAGNKDPVARCWAAWGMRDCGDASCIDPLIAALADSSPDVRNAACYALLRLWPGATPEQYDKAMAALIQLVDEYGTRGDNYPRGMLEDTLCRLNAGVTPPKDDDNHKLAEAWRAIWRQARDKK